MADDRTACLKGLLILIAPDKKDRVARHILDPQGRCLTSAAYEAGPRRVPNPRGTVPCA